MIAYLKQPNTRAALSLKTEAVRQLPEWSKDTPYAIKGDSILEAIHTVQMAKRKYLKDGEITDCKFKSRKSPSQSIPIQKSAVNSKGIYIRSLGTLKTTKPLEGSSDGRLVCESGRWFYVESREVPVIEPENQRFYAVAIDPGVRTFATLYSPELSGKVGFQDVGRIQRLCHYLDGLVSEISKSSGKRKYRLRKAANRLRWKIKDLVKEMHTKLAVWLCKTFRIVFLPTFNTSDMVLKGGRKISSRSVRQMLTLSHYSFKQTLKGLAERYSTTVIDVNEAYTSKTCSACGRIHKIGSKKQLVCECGCLIDRDVNGARGIFLRALCDHTCLLVNNPQVA